MTPLETLDRIQEIVNLPLARYLEQRQRIEQGLPLWLPSGVHHTERLTFMVGNLREADLVGANLTRANLMQVSLYRADLTDANLQDVAFTGSTLRHAILRGANLAGANFAYADLRDVDFSHVTLFATYFMGAKRLPSDAQIPGWKLVRGRLRRV